MHDYYDLAGPAQNLEPRYNVAPTDNIGTIRSSDGRHQHAPMRWWLIPAWWKKPLKDLPSAFNAKAEGIADKPFFRSAFRRQRCIVWADGFYEWRREAKTKTPFFITRADGAPLSLAGLWESWTNPDDDSIMLSCTIITCPANEAMRTLHNRMPVVLEKSVVDGWLNGTAGSELLTPCADDLLVRHEVSAYVSNARNQGSRCIVPVTDSHQ